MPNQKLHYELDVNVVNYILTALDRVQIAWVEQAKNLLTVTELLQNPANKDELDKETYEKLKEKFEKKPTK